VPSTVFVLKTFFFKKMQTGQQTEQEKGGRE